MNRQLKSARAQLTVHYADGCFCERRLGDGACVKEGPVVEMEPRFEFKKAVKKWAEELNVTDLKFNKTDKSALGTFAESCRHRAQQTVRFGWKLQY